MSSNPTVSYPRKATDPAKIVKDRISTAPPEQVPFPMQARNKSEARKAAPAPTHRELTSRHVFFLEKEMARLDGHMATLKEEFQATLARLQREYDHRRAEVQHLEAYLAVAAPQGKE